MTRNEDFLFAQEAIAQGFVSEAQVEEALLLQRRMAEDLKLDERLGVILVKRGYLAEDQARRVYARIAPEKAGEIRGYRLLDVIGRGAMGTVYRALHLGLNRVVALKILRPDLQSDRTQIERLKAEAAMLASVDHPNVVRVLDAGESNGFPYFVMEYVEGETLRDRIRREGALPEAEALRITRAIADALERARRMGIVHRDVKPGNVLLSRGGTPKLMDLGLAKGPIDLGLTQHGATVGTPQYISPEQAVDPRKADSRSDIYGLGATLYAMLTGEPPFDGQTLAEILTKVLYETPVPVRTRRPGVSREAGFLVERMMLKDPSLRYRVPAAVVADIDRIEQGTSILPAGFVGSWEGWLLRARTRKMLLLGAGSVAAAVLLAAGAWWFVSRQRESSVRESLERRIGQVLERTAVGVDDDEQDLRKKLDALRPLREEAKEVETRSRVALLDRVTDVDQALAHLESLSTLVRKRVQPALESGEYAFAEGELDRFLEASRTPPARRAAEARRAQVRDDSDAALRRKRLEQFERHPKTFAEAAATLEEWHVRTLPRFAATPETLAERRQAFEAHKAAGAILREIEAALASSGPDDVAARVAALDLKTLRDDLDARRLRATTDVGRHLPALERYFGRSVEALVERPFDDALTELTARVERVYLEEAAGADVLVASHRVLDAIDRLERLERAARGSFPSVAGWAREKASVLQQQHAKHLEEAEVAWARVLAQARAALRASDAPALRALVARLEADEAAFPSVRERAHRLLETADLLDAFWGRVVSGFEARVGPERERWLDAVVLRDGTRDRWEVRGVDRAARTITVVSHWGNVSRPPEVRPLADLHPDLLVQRAGLGSDPRDAAMEAVYRLSLLPDDASDLDPATNPRERAEAYRRVRDLFDAAKQGSAPLALWVFDRHEALEERIRATEQRAADALASARRAYDRDENAAAFGRLRSLKQPPLVFTRVREQNAAAIDDLLAQIVQEEKNNRLSLLIPGAKVEGLHGEALQIALDFDEPVQLENVREGLARLVRAPPGAALTPDERVENWRLRLLPGPDGGAMPEGMVVRDRPLVLDSMLDPTRERSIAFRYWPLSPFFLAIDLDGVQVGVLSADPKRFPFADAVPSLDHEKRPPAHDFYGRGRGVVLRAGVSLEKPWEWNAWETDHHGRRFLSPEREKPARAQQMDRRWFAFEPSDRATHLRLVHNPETGTVRFEVDGREVAAETKIAWRARPEGQVAPSGSLRILSFTTCDVDDLVLTGRVSERWRRAAMERKGLAEPEGTK